MLISCCGKQTLYSMDTEEFELPENLQLKALTWNPNNICQTVGYVAYKYTVISMYGLTVLSPAVTL
jgi:hypothetical protein